MFPLVQPCNHPLLPERGTKQQTQTISYFTSCQQTNSLYNCSGFSYAFNTSLVVLAFLNIDP